MEGSCLPNVDSEFQAASISGPSLSTQASIIIRAGEETAWRSTPLLFRTANQREVPHHSHSHFIGLSKSSDLAQLEEVGEDCSYAPRRKGQQGTWVKNTGRE